jgi:arsenite methyltransferase
MAELSEPAATSVRSSCCWPEAQSGCCEPAEKPRCFDSGVTDGVAAPAEQSAKAAEIHGTVREKYAAAARAAAEQRTAASCCGPISLTDGDEHRVFGAALYDEAETAGTAASALAASLGCGVPTAVADLQPGETVLDLGSGAGADVLISARRVGPAGRAIGLDMTDEMLELARRNAAGAGVVNVVFVKGYIEDIPLADASVDVIVSNCVLNLSADKPRVLREAARSRPRSQSSSAACATRSLRGCSSPREPDMAARMAGRTARRAVGPADSDGRRPSGEADGLAALAPVSEWREFS